MECTRRLKEVRVQRYCDLEAVKLRNIVDMALSFTAMMRLFEEGSKETIQAEILNRLPGLFTTRSEDEFKAAHHSFCVWGMKEIKRTKGKGANKSTKVSDLTSYGHMAKILDVVLHVVIHYAQRPDPETAKKLSKWLNPAMDTRMMVFLAGCYPDVLKPWPKTIEQVGREEYKVIQNIVRQFIKDEHKGKIIPMDFDDIYWEVLNRKVVHLILEQ